MLDILAWGHDPALLVLIAAAVVPKLSPLREVVHNAQAVGKVTRDAVSLPLKIVASYCLLATIMALGPFLIRLTSVEQWRADVFAFIVIIAAGLLIVPVWRLRPRWLPAVLMAWWAPQLFVVTRLQRAQGGGLSSTYEFRSVLLLFAGPNYGFEIGPSTYRLLHLNIFAAVAILLISVAFIGGLARARREDKARTKATAVNASMLE